MITCYLDSQDYSTLTDPKTLTPDNIKIRDALVNFSRKGTVQFVYSAAAISEAVAVSPNATQLAELRAELLSDLCGRNALVSFDRLMRAEVGAVIEGAPHPISMLDPNGDWFPEISKENIDIPSERKINQRVEENQSNVPLSRKQRRDADKRSKKNGQSHKESKFRLNQQNSTLFATAILRQYAMKKEYAETVAKYCLGLASEDEFSDALMLSLRDPVWMMKWFSTNHAMSSPISDMVRKPGRELGIYIRELVEISSSWALFLKENHLDLDPTGKQGEISRRWLKTQDDQLFYLIQRAASEKNISLESIASADIKVRCPGLSATIRALYSSVWENIGGSRKEEPSDSQPVDAMHAMYAPYVRVFRADRFMSPHIQKQVKRHGTIVVSRLANLVEVLEKEIQKDIANAT